MTTVELKNLMTTYIQPIIAECFLHEKEILKQVVKEEVLNMLKSLQKQGYTLTKTNVNESIQVKQNTQQIPVKKTVQQQIPTKKVNPQIIEQKKTQMKQLLDSQFKQPVQQQSNKQYISKPLPTQQVKQVAKFQEDPQKATINILRQTLDEMKRGVGVPGIDYENSIPQVDNKSRPSLMSQINVPMEQNYDEDDLGEIEEFNPSTVQLPI